MGIDLAKMRANRKPVLLRLTRDVTPEECDWLDETFREGRIVQRCYEPTYGCVTPFGTPVTLSEDGGYPFFELPTDALVGVGEDGGDHNGN